MTRIQARHAILVFCKTIMVLLLSHSIAHANKEFYGTVQTELFSADNVRLTDCNGHWRTDVTSGAGIPITLLPDEVTVNGTQHNRTNSWTTSYWQDFGGKQAGSYCGVAECPSDPNIRYMGSGARWSPNSQFHKMNIPITYDRCGSGLCLNCGCGKVGNPCDPATGNKYQVETDYTSSVGLSVVRHYNSRNKIDVGFGTGWSSSISKHLEIERHIGQDSIIVRSDTGRGELFIKDHGTGLWGTDAETKIAITEDTSGIQLIHENDHTENYNAQGRLISETTPAGKTTSYGYNSYGYLTQITSHFGQVLQIERYYSFNYIVSITTPTGDIIDYDFIGGTYRNLKSVTYPDNTTRTYHYENTSYPNHLTGITDENGVRYATFAYDSQGRAISTEHADIGGGAQEKFQINYGL